MLLKYFFELPPLIPSSVLIRRNIFDKIGLFDEELPIALDTDIFLRIASYYPIGLINYPLAIYRRHANSLSNRIYSPSIHLRLLKNFMCVERKIKKRDEAAINKIYAELYMDYAESLSHSGKPEEARKQVLNYFHYARISKRGIALFLKTILPANLIMYLKMIKKRFAKLKKCYG